MEAAGIAVVIHPPRDPEDTGAPAAFHLCAVSGREIRGDVSGEPRREVGASTTATKGSVRSDALAGAVDPDINLIYAADSPEFGGPDRKPRFDLCAHLAGDAQVLKTEADARADEAALSACPLLGGCLSGVLVEVIDLLRLSATGNPGPE